MSLTSVADALELRRGKRLVFTNGVFDILHAGHIDSLKRAKELGEYLVVALNTDASARKLGKGPNRPVNTLEDRAAVLGAIRFVDAVIEFDSDNPIPLIEQLRPEVYVKGGDYQIADLQETSIVEGYGGTVVILPLLLGRSTTVIVERCKSDEGL